MIPTLRCQNSTNYPLSRGATGASTRQHLQPLSSRNHSSRQPPIPPGEDASGVVTPTADSSERPAIGAGNSTHFLCSSPVPARIHSALRLALHALYTRLSECGGARRNYLAENSHQVVRRRERRAFNPRDQPSPVHPLSG